MFNVLKKTRSEFIICLFLVLIILATYWQLPSHEFLSFDDNQYITQNTHVHEGITWENILWTFSRPNTGYWQPLTWMSHMLAFQVFGLKFGMHHLINLFLHISNSLLLFFVFNRMTSAPWQSAFIAAAFALHPLNVESVAWVSERKNVLSTFFWMLTILTYIRYTERPGIYRYMLILFVFVLGLMSKPMLVTLPFVLLLLDYWPLCRLNLARLRSDEQKTQSSEITGFQMSFVLRLILEKIPLAILSIACIYLTTSLSIQRFKFVIPTASVPMKLRIANALVSYVGYIKKMICPINLAAYYPYPHTLPTWQVIGASLLLVSVTFLAYRWVRLKPYFTVGWLWYIGTLIPVIGLVQAGLWPAIADRFAYVPLIGLFMVIAWGVPDLLFRWRYKKKGIIAISTALVPVLMGISWLQLRHWQNSVTLFTHIIRVTHNNCLAHNELGKALEQQGDFDKAIFHYSKALKINPKYAEAHKNLGYILACQKHYKEAIDHYTEAIRIKPSYAEVYNNMGTVFLFQGNEKEAIYHYYKALRINPNYAGVYYNLGKINLNHGNIEKAILLYRKAIELNPEMTQVLYNLSWILASHEDEKYRNGEEAVKLAKMLCKVTLYKQPMALDALALAYAETKRFDVAVLTAQKALKLALVYGPQEVVFGLTKRLQLYQAKLPFRQSFPG
jgi:protein O-mannosyl-transferase